MNDFKASKLSNLSKELQKPESYKMEELQEPAENPIELQDNEQRQFRKLQNELKSKYPSLDEMNSEFGKHQSDPFLLSISKLESDLGGNTAHAQMKHGMHKGNAAIGTYGLMPNTIQDIMSNYDNKQSALRYRLGPDYQDPEIEALRDMDKEAYAEYIANNPQTETKLARYLSLMLAQRMQDDPRRMAYGWNQGSSYRKKDVSDSTLNQHPYVKRFDEFSNLYESDPRFISESELTSSED